MSWRQKPEKDRKTIQLHQKKENNSEEIFHQMNEWLFPTTIIGADWVKVSALLDRLLNSRPFVKSLIVTSQHA